MAFYIICFLMSVLVFNLIGMMGRITPEHVSTTDRIDLQKDISIERSLWTGFISNSVTVKAIRLKRILKRLCRIYAAGVHHSDRTVAP